MQESNNNQAKGKTMQAVSGLYKVRAQIARSCAFNRHGAARVAGGRVIAETPWQDYRDIPIYIAEDQMREEHPNCDILVHLKP